MNPLAEALAKVIGWTIGMVINIVLLGGILALVAAGAIAVSVIV